MPVFVSLCTSPPSPGMLLSSDFTSKHVHVRNENDRTCSKAANIMKKQLYLYVSPTDPTAQEMVMIICSELATIKENFLGIHLSLIYQNSAEQYESSESVSLIDR